MFSKLGASKVVGIDADHLGIEKANYVKKILNHKDVIFKHGNVYEELRNEANYDLVLCLGFLHRIPSPYDFLKLIQKNTESIIFEWKSPPDEAPHSLKLWWDGVNEEENNYSKAYYRISINAVITILREFGFINFRVHDDIVKNRPLLFASKSGNKAIDVQADKIKLFSRLTRRYFSDIKQLFSSFYK
tara:strand:- start:1685 stop:2248 length:564 start_codon:yes stop_codon:yes gene_type:complete